jgi:predicted methyltransferase
MRRLILLLCLALCVPALAADGPRHREHDWGDVKHWSKVFDDPARDEWQKPLSVLQFLAISRGDKVADLGAGTGYFTRLLAIMVGPEGKVFAADTERAMLKHLSKREDIDQSRVETIRCKPDDPKLPEGQVDLLLAVNTWHHIEERGDYLGKVRQALSPEGRVAIVDFIEGELPVGPPAGHKLAKEAVVAEFEEQGWRLVAESFALPYQYLLIFLPPKTPDNRKFVSR